MSDYSFKIEEIQNPTIDPAVPNPYGAKSFETVKYHTPITPLHLAIASGITNGCIKFISK